MKNWLLVLLSVLGCILPAQTAGSYELADFGITALILAVIAVALSATMAALTPKPDLEDQKPSGLGDYQFPTNLESRYLPVVWGSSELAAPNVIWYGDFSTYPLTTGGQIIGYRYSLGIDLALCYGPIDSISEIQIDDKYVLKQGEQRALKSGITPLGGFERPSTGERRISLEDLEFFGGDKAGGRLIGNMSIYYGSDNQKPCPYIQRQETENTLEVTPGTFVSQSQLVPSYSGLAHVVWEGGEISERAVIPQIKFTVHRYPTSLSATYSIVNDDGNGIGDANPIHCLYELLTDTRWGCGVPDSDIDTESFFDAAELCSIEGNGFGYTLDDPKAASTVIELINQQVNGVLFQNGEGKWAYRLIRKDYDTDYNFELRYDGKVAGTRNSISSGLGLFAASSGAGDYMISLLTTDLSSLVIGEVIEIVNTSTDDVMNFIIADVDDGADEIYLTLMDSQEYPDTWPGLSTFTTARITDYSYLQEFTKSSISKVTAADRQSWSETFNVAQVKYIDRTDYYKESVATSHDMGNFAIRNGVHTIKKFDMPGVRTPASAAKIAQRLLRSVSYPITTLSVEVPRRFYQIRPGDVVVVNHSDYGLENFYMRVLEVGLPNDRGTSISVKGMRDTYNEPSNAEVIHIGGASDISDQISTAPVAPNPDTTYTTGLPLFYHTKLGLDSLYYKWHIIGSPDRNTSFGVGRGVLTDFATFVDRTPVLSLPPTGKVKAHPDRLWDDVAGIDQKWYGKENADHVYGPEAGPHGNPQRADSNTGSAWNASLAKQEGGNYYYAFQGEPAAKSLGDLIVTDLTTPPESLASEFTQEAIQEEGYGLALIRPRWAADSTYHNASRTQYDEIIAYERAEPFTLYYGFDYLVDGSRIDEFPVSEADPAFFIYSISPTPQQVVLEARTGISLFGVHRGLLDTGIQVLNNDSDIIFLHEGDIMYDLVGTASSAVTQLSFPQTMSSGGKLPMAESFVLQTTQAQRERRAKTLGIKNVTIGAGAFNQAWGTMYYDNGEWQNLTFPAWGSGSTTISWGYKDESASPDEVNLYTETDAVSRYAKITFNLIEDDDNGANATERLAHARAYWKEGLRPTSPALDHPSVGGTGTPLTAFPATATYYVSGTSTSYDLGTVFSGANTTASELYYCEILLQSCTDGSGSNLSFGCQRMVVSFIA